MSLYKPKAVYAASERNTLSRWRNSSTYGMVFTSNGRLSEEGVG